MSPEESFKEDVDPLSIVTDPPLPEVASPPEKVTLPPIPPLPPVTVTNPPANDSLLPPAEIDIVPAASFRALPVAILTCPLLPLREEAEDNVKSPVVP